MEGSNHSSGDKVKQVTEDVCFELLYFAKLMSIINVRKGLLILTAGEWHS